MRAEEAIVLVGGLGTRLRSVVADVPKPLAPVAGRPFLAWVLDRLATGGMRRVVMASGYRAERIEDVVGSRWGGMEIAYSVEDAPLGTGGAVRLASTLVHGDGVHVVNGDTFLDYSPAALEAVVRDSGASMGIALSHVDDVARYGAVEVAGNRVTRFEEKGRAGPGWINAGCYFLAPAAIAALPAEQRFSFEDAFLVPQAAAGRVAPFTDTQGFIDIGVPADYQRAQAVFAAPR